MKKYFQIIVIIGLVVFNTASSYAERKIIQLSGEWQIAPGEKIPESFNYKVPVPGLVDLSDPSFSWQKEKYFWYKKTFTLETKQKKPHAFIKIDQSQFGTTVYLNGKELGTYIGCYTSHEYNAGQAINYKGENTLLVRVGAKETLSADSAVGHDWERVSYIPGIWGDVSLYFTDEIKIENIQVIPRIDTGSALIKISVKNLSDKKQDAVTKIEISEKESGKKAGTVSFKFSLNAGEEKIEEKEVKLKDVKLWSPDNPFLYRSEVWVLQKDKVIENLSAVFGMREFKIEGGDFYLNGNKIVLKGSNIAFHRFLSDPERKGLVWDEKWIKELLVDIPKAHNFNFFRNHIGQMYNRWYDIADEGGILLQNEWAFWSMPTGSREQIKKEFTQWLKDNWNHPSIIIWDSLNEPTYDYPDRLPLINYVKHDLTAEMKKLDPTRPWEPTDFEEIHPYIYSVHSVLGGKSEGTLNYLDTIKNTKTPTAANEYIYFWIDKEGKISDLTKNVAIRWVGEDSTVEQRLDFQAFLASELTELFRRMGVDEIAPFVYLSVNEGATSHWFKGNIKNLEPKPVLKALKNVFLPLGVSIDIWDRHFFTKQKIKTDVYLFNDYPSLKKGELVCRITDEKGKVISEIKRQRVEIGASSVKKENIEWQMVSSPGTYYLEAELIPNGKPSGAKSRKVIHLFDTVRAPKNLKNRNIMVFDPDKEINKFLTQKGIEINDFNINSLKKQDILIIGEGGLNSKEYKNNIKQITNFVKKGKTLIFIEPSYTFKNDNEEDICEGISLTVDQRWRGPESYVFIEDSKFPLWEGLDKEHLKMFNGAWGGEIVSDYDIIPPMPFLVRAKCGLGLTIPAVMETYTGDGLVVFSRIQVRERLIENSKNKDFYDRRVDPVAQQYLMNLIATYQPGSKTVKNILEQLKSKKVVFRKIKASSVQDINYSPLYAADNDKSTRWSSLSSDPQWILVDLGDIRDLYGVRLNWETACAKEYQIQISEDYKRWNTVLNVTNGDGGIDFVKFEKAVKARFVKMYGIKRATDWGYSLWEFEVYTDESELPSEKSLKSEKIINPVVPKSIKASSVQDEEYKASYAADGDDKTRWSSLANDEEWIMMDFGQPEEINKVTLNWETAFASAYKIQVSHDGKKWHDVYSTDNSDGGIDEIILKKPVKYRYLRIFGIKRGTQWGYSLWEVNVFGL